MRARSAVRLTLLFCYGNKYAAFIRSVKKYGYIYIMYAKFHMKFLHIS